MKGPAVRSADLPRSDRQYVPVDPSICAPNDPGARCVHQLIEQQVERTPHAIALVLGSESLTYAELNRRANQLAHFLRRLGVGPEACVAICVEPGFDMMVAVLAVLKAGGFFVPVDPTYPAERIHFILQDSASVALLTQGHLLEDFSAFEAALPVLDLSATDPAWSTEPETNPDAGQIGVSSSNLAQVIFTSGSTGQPKGVLLEHRTLRVMSRWFIQEFKLTHEYVSLVATSASFLTVYKNIYATLFVGGQLHLVKNPKDPNAILSTAFRANATFLNCSPTTFSMIVEADSKNELAKIKTVMLTGEPLRLHRFAKLAQPRPEFVNTYGQTEMSMATFNRISGDSDFSQQRIAPIGRPVSFARVYILDEQANPVPAGEEGELYIGGPGVARGYLNRPDLTAEKFLADPFASEPGARMFRTGDLARQLPDGTLDFLGRNDFQVKIRGIRIEPGETEARLMEHPAVREAVVIAREDAPGDQRLVAYYLASAVAPTVHDSSLADQLRAHVAATLPDFMVPAAYLRVESFPLTASGKLDRRSLPAPGSDAYTNNQNFEQPQGATETETAAIWAEVLKLDSVGRHDHFFSLGGNSLLAMKVSVRLRNAFQIEVPVSCVFQNPTLKSFAHAVDELRDSSQNDTELLLILEELEAMPESKMEGVG